MFDTLFIGKNFVVYDEIPSTNSYAQQLLAENPPEGTVVFTNRQTAGRGQAGSEWFSAEEKNLTFSLILRPTFIPIDELFLLSKMVAVALRSALQKVQEDGHFQIKWANDILLSHKKIAGILIENQLDGVGISYSIIGIGINVNQIHFPKDIADTAISLKQFSGKDFEVLSVLAIVLKEMEAFYLLLKEGKKNMIESEYLQHLYGYQEDIYVEIAGEKQQVYVVGVEKSGRIALMQGGKMRYFDIKEIKWTLP